MNISCLKQPQNSRSSRYSDRNQNSPRWQTVDIAAKASRVAHHSNLWFWSTPRTMGGWPIAHWDAPKKFQSHRAAFASHSWVLIACRGRTTRHSFDIGLLEERRRWNSSGAGRKISQQTLALPHLLALSFPSAESSLFVGPFETLVSLNAVNSDPDRLRRSQISTTGSLLILSLSPVSTGARSKCE